MAKRQKRRSQKPSRTDIASGEIEKEILDFWRAIGNNELQDWDRPWVYNAFHGENAGKYLKGEDRYTYQGGFNQFLIAFYNKMRQSDMSPLILNRGDIAEFFDAEKFAETPVVKNGVKSLGSLYSPPREKKIGSQWRYPDNSLWKPSGSDKSRPSSQQIASLNLTEEPIKRFVFSSYPVWSAADVYEHLPSKYQKKVDELMELRSAKGYDFNPEDDIEQYIDARLDEMIQRMGITVKEHGNEAFYRPTLDDISRPNKRQFKNPVVRFAVTAHELAHSTKHITGRLAVNRKKVDYAKEEVVAETTAVMMVKRLENDLRSAIETRKDVSQMFEDYYKNAMTYNKGWGSKFDFLKLVEQLNEEKESPVIKTTLVNIAKAVDVLTHQSFTPEQRLEAKVKNIEKQRVAEAEHKNDSGNTFTL